MHLDGQTLPDLGVADINSEDIVPETEPHHSVKMTKLCFASAFTDCIVVSDAIAVSFCIAES